MSLHFFNTLSWLFVELSKLHCYNARILQHNRYR